MPNRWESSTRPLSVKTVYVNGSRHAILSPEDPLLRSGIFSLKKQSRPNSSMSILSISSSQSQDSVLAARIRSSKSETVRGGRGKELPSMLQGCFVKLRLTSSTGQRVKKGDANLVHSEEVMKTDYPYKTKNCYSYEEFSKGNKLAETRVENNNCCYVYDFENKKRKKNYCFVKITSGKPSHFIDKCSCGKNWEKAQDMCDSKDCNKNNYVISATIRNLILGAEENENQSDDLFSTGDKDLCEGRRNFYNPLPERVFQWINLRSKQKNSEGAFKKSSEDLTSLSNVERISAGNTFIDEYNKSRYCEKSCNKIDIKGALKKGLHRNTFEKDVESEVKTEENVETVLSMLPIDNNWECIKEKFSSVLGEKLKQLAVRKESNGNHLLKDGQSDKKHKVSGIPTKIDATSLVTTLLKNSIVNRLNYGLWSRTVSTTDIQELLDKKDPQFIYHSKKKSLRERCESMAKRSILREGEEDGNENEKFKITGVKFWDRNANRSCSVNEITACQSIEKESEKTMKNQNLNKEFEKYQKGINNRNITRSGSVSQNLYPQQHGKSVWLRNKKSVWLPEKNTSRPQLHIFIPPLISKDLPDETLSENGSFT